MYCSQSCNRRANPIASEQRMKMVESRKKFIKDHPEYIESFKEKMRAFYKNGGVTVKGKHWKYPKEAVERKHKFHGTHNEYNRIHIWVYKMLGRPDICEFCGQKGTGKKMNWANKSQEYKRELTDWLRLCPPCHTNYDLNFVKQSV